MPPKRKPKKKTTKGGGLYDKTMNLLTGSDLQPGERHPPMRTKWGFKPGNYVGPGTHVLEKTKKGVKPINFTDKNANAHDIRYSLAKDRKDVRNADKKMVEVSNRGLKDKSDYKFNLRQTKYGILAKMKLEDAGISPERFTDFGGDLEPEDRKVLEDRLAELEQDGFGKKKKSQKGRGNPWLSHLKSYRADHPEKSYKQCMKDAAKTYKK